jgi:hypothetical protein
MASDITLAVGDGTRRMTYAELAEARGISLASARRLARRHHWPRQIGNDGVVRILVPLGHLHVVSQPTRSKPIESHDIDGPGPAYDMSQGTEARAGLRHLRAFESIIEALREQLTKAEQRADEAQAAERKAIELVKYVTAEASEQRRKADDATAAERIARDEAAGLRAELEARKQWSLWRRVRGR